MLTDDGEPRRGDLPVPQPEVGEMVEPPIATLIVDDESLSRDRLRVLLEGEPDVAIVGECANGLQALDAISAQRPELVFLDIQMPDLDGLGVLDALGCAEQDSCPEFIFVTAYNQYWERAFEVHAVDYLRKPYTNARFHSALEHARRHVLARRQERGGLPPARYAATVEAIRAERQSVRPDGRIVVLDRSTDTWHLIATDGIDWIETAGGGHVRLHCGEDSYQWRKSITEVEQELVSHGFLRVHRSYIVNTARIASVKDLHKGEYAIVLDRGNIIDTGRTYRDAVTRFLSRA